MVCACVHRGWDPRTYVRPDHPLQQANLNLLAEVTVTPAQDIEIAIDGCGVPTFGVALRAFAHAFARLAAPSALPVRHGEAGERVRDAMLSNPAMVAGEGRFDTRLMEALGGRVLAKSGAEACQGLAIVDRRWGIAVKIEDGGARAVAVAALEALRQLDALADGELDRLEDLWRPLVRNYRNEIVGEGRALFALQRPS